MKKIIHLLFVLLVFAGIGCNRQQVSQNEAELVEEKHWLDDLWWEDTIRFHYAKPVNGYEAEGVLFLGGGGSPTYDLILTDSATHKSIKCTGGFLFWSDAEEMFPDEERLVLENDFFEGETYALISGELFDFIDLDFDGEKELVTGLNPHHGERMSGSFGLIYKIRDGVAVDVTDEFYAKSKVFLHMDRSWFCVDYTRREIQLHWGSGIQLGYSAYKFSDGSYTHDRNVRYDYLDGKYQATVLTPQGDTVKEYIVEDYRAECEYLWDTLQKYYWCERCGCWHGEYRTPICPNQDISADRWVDRLIMALRNLWNS